MLIYSHINTSGNWENEKLCGNTTPEGGSVFTQFQVFPISTSVDITVYQYGKNVLYFFYNIAQRSIKKEISVLTLSYINTALSQSAFRIYKCYIINYNLSLEKCNFAESYTVTYFNTSKSPASHLVNSHLVVKFY